MLVVERHLERYDQKLCDSKWALRGDGLKKRPVLMMVTSQRRNMTTENVKDERHKYLQGQQIKALSLL